jgi:hypothetical protein
MKTHTVAATHVTCLAALALALALALGACGQTAEESCGESAAAGCVQTARTIPPEALPPAGYVVTWSTCTHFMEGNARLRNNSRVVQVRKDGTIPLQRVEPVSDPKDNFRRVLVAKLPKPLLGGTGVLRRAAEQQPSANNEENVGVVALALTGPSTPVQFIKLGQGVTSREADGSIVDWVVSSEQLGEPVLNEASGKLEYQDTCFRNPSTAGHDTSGYLTTGTELSPSCLVEAIGQGFNTYSIYGYLPLMNYTTLIVPTLNNPATRPLPEIYAWYLGFDGTSYNYTGMGAALNDINGTERDQFTLYYPYDIYCHMVLSGGLEVPGAKRPATKTLPAPGGVVRNSYNVWRPVSPNFVIANDQPPTAPDPVEPEPPVADVPVDAADAMVPM